MTSSLDGLVRNAIEFNSPATNLLAGRRYSLVVPRLPALHHSTLELQNPSFSGDKVDHGILITRVDQHAVVGVFDQRLVNWDDGTSVKIVVGSTALLPCDGLHVQSFLDGGVVQIRSDMIIDAGILVRNIALGDLGFAHAIDQRMREADVLEHALRAAHIVQNIVGLQTKRQR